MPYVARVAIEKLALALKQHRIEIPVYRQLRVAALQLPPGSDVRHGRPPEMKMRRPPWRAERCILPDRCDPDPGLCCGIGVLGLVRGRCRTRLSFRIWHLRASMGAGGWRRPTCPAIDHAQARYATGSCCATFLRRR